MKSKNIIPNRIIFVLYNIVMSALIWTVTWNLLNIVFVPTSTIQDGMARLGYFVVTLYIAVAFTFLTAGVMMAVQHKILHSQLEGNHASIFTVGTSLKLYAFVIIVVMAFLLYQNIAHLIFMSTFTFSLITGASYLYIHQNSPQREKAKRA